MAAWLDDQDAKTASWWRTFDAHCCVGYDEAMNLYEPIDTIKPVHDGLFIVDGPIVKMAMGPFRMPFPTRMVIARVADAGLFVWSPTQLSETLRNQIDRLGVVRHLISPNRIHYAHIEAWKAAYPKAVAWASAGVRERAAEQRIQVSFDRDLTDTPPPAWSAELDQLVFRGSRFMEEVVFFHRASRTLIVADLIENFEPSKLGAPLSWLVRLGGVADPDGKMPRDLRATYAGRRELARASLERILAWEPERIVLAHGRWYAEDGVRELRRAFRWLM